MFLIIVAVLVFLISRAVAGRQRARVGTGAGGADGADGAPNEAAVESDPLLPSTHQTYTSTATN